MRFAATTREAARKQARKYLKETYGNSFEIISINYQHLKFKKIWQQQIGQLSEEKKQVTKC